MQLINTLLLALPLTLGVTARGVPKREEHDVEKRSTTICGQYDTTSVRSFLQLVLYHHIVLC